jgi:hypothetical protein
LKAVLAKERQKGIKMADISAYDIETFQREPGRWRANITPKLQVKGKSGQEMRGFITKGDCPSEADAQTAAHDAIRKLTA